MGAVDTTGALARPGQPGMRRILGIPSLVVFGLAYMLPLTVWTTYGVGTTLSGGHLPTAYLLTTAAMLLTALSYGRMVNAFPVAGSAYTYVSGAFGQKSGFLVGWVLLLDYLFIPMICYLAIGLYMHDFFPALPMWAWIVGPIVAVTGFNIFGLKVVTKVNLAVVGMSVVFIGVFVALSIAKIAGAGGVSLAAPFVSEGMSLSGVAAASAVLALSFLGFDAVSTLSEETHNPRVRIPRAIVLVAFIGGSIFVLQSYVGHLIFPNYEDFTSVDLASVDVITRAGGESLNALFIAAYVAGCVACAAAGQASVSRILFAMGRDGVLPRRLFGRLHPRFRTPVLANVVVGIIGLSALVLSLTTVSSMISFGALVAFSMVNMAVVKHFYFDERRRSAGDTVKFLVLPALGVVVTLYLWTSLSRLTFEIGLVWAAAGFVYLVVATRGFTKQAPALALQDAESTELAVGTAATAREKA
ncbi:APC family permease [Mycolicibacterium goodii]|uniref:APC family permease n=1 Tax=Mycolicibacterium goodii TaxID=134601 RepID=UPI001BDC4040|nr:APC family permease [Mycolicibacterium goodii]MBU8819657.1 APC family permease [Mycolicibacterium goodii]MBU8833962.1 APC family permease [Mycolicibacterium goodii]